MRVAIAERDDPVPVRHAHGRATLRRRAGASGGRAALRPPQPADDHLGTRGVSGHQGRPTLLSNAETWARIGLLALHGAREYARIGTAPEPGATLLTVGVSGLRPGGPRGSPTALGCSTSCRVSGTVDRCWSAASTAPGRRGRRWPACGCPRPGCERSARRSGPACCCRSEPTTARSSSPAASSSTWPDRAPAAAGRASTGSPRWRRRSTRSARGVGGTARVDELAGLVVRRGACAHPDGTVRLVRSLLSTFASEVSAHASGACRWTWPAEAERGVA